MKEITNTRIVAITQNNIAFEMLFVMFKFFLYIRKLRVKLVFLGVLGCV